MELLAKVYGSPIIAAEEDHMAGLHVECRLGGIWAERPQKDLERLSCSSSLPSWYECHPPAEWLHS
jgi:hypothetical protein